MNTLRQDLARMLSGYRTTTAEPVTSDPEPEVRHAQPAPPAKRRGKRRATMPAKDLSPETMDPSPEQ